MGLIGLLDVVGLYILFNWKKLITVMGDIDIKILGVGLGWAAADLATNNLLYIIFQAWSYEFKNEYLVSAISNNFELLEILAIANFAYGLTQKDESGARNFTAYMLIMLRYLHPSIMRIIKESP